MPTNAKGQRSDGVVDDEDRRLRDDCHEQGCVQIQQVHVPGGGVLGDSVWAGGSAWRGGSLSWRRLHLGRRRLGRRSSGLQSCGGEENNTVWVIITNSHVHVGVHKLCSLCVLLDVVAIISLYTLERVQRVGRDEKSGKTQFVTM